VVNWVKKQGKDFINMLDRIDVIWLSYFHAAMICV